MNIDDLLQERPALAALIFDVDGTVAETEDLHRRAFNLAFARHAVDLWWDPRQYRRLLEVRGGKERIARSLAEHERALPAEAIARIHATKTEAYDALVRTEGAPWRPGIARLMGEARQRGLALAIATTTTEANLEPLFAPVMGRAWRAAFAAIVAGDAVARKKPAPDVYLEALRRLGLRPAQCIAFEDSQAGVRSARAAGLAVVATRSDWLPHDDLREAQLALEHLGDSDRLWDEPHPLLGQRWLSAKALMAWHSQAVAA